MARCGKGEALIAVDDRMPGHRRPGERFFQGSCCSLPADDIVGDSVVESNWECPVDFIAVGVRFPIDCKGCLDSILCAKINLQKYRLSARMPGVPFGAGVSDFSAKDRLSFAQLPASIRPGVSRVTFNQWDRDGCIGSTPGGLYIGSRQNGACDAHGFRMLLRRSDGLPVKMFPDCISSADPLRPERGCYERTGE